MDFGTRTLIAALGAYFLGAVYLGGLIAAGLDGGNKAVVAFAIAAAGTGYLAQLADAYLWRWPCLALWTVSIVCGIASAMLYLRG